jgi:hypothetical protein
MESQKVILEEMCRIVGADYEEMFPLMCDKDSNWYYKYSWTAEEEKDFQKWLSNYLVKKAGVNRKIANLKASYFVLNYGWKTKKLGERIS